MKVSIRTKILITLLVFSLGPLLVTRMLTGRKSAELSTKLAERTHMELLDIVSKELEHNAVSLSTLLDTTGQFIETMARSTALQAGHALESATPPSAEAPVFASNMQGMGMHGPGGDATDFPYTMTTRNNGIKPIAIDPEAPAFRLPHNPSGNAGIELQVQQLLNLKESLKTLYPSLRKFAAWINVGLESGVFMTYPGHGRFPMQYDHRVQRWYQRCKELGPGETHWSAPILDPARRIAVSTASYPIHDTAGNFLGAVSVDIPMTAIVSSEKLRSRWSSDIQSFLVVPAEREEGGRDELLIVAQQAYDTAGHRHWMSGIERQWLASEDDAQFTTFLELMEEHKSGTMFLPYKGERSVWAFASNDDYSFILIAPESTVSQLPDDVTGSFIWLFDQMRTISLALSLIMVVIVSLIAWFGAKKVSRPLLAIAKKARRLANGDFTVHIDHRTGDERDVLIKSFNDMVPKLKEHMTLSRDMELAQEVQTLLLPPDNPDVPGFDIAGGIAYCDQTGGDYYDFIDVETENGFGLGVVLGDVSGHGVPASLIMAAARGQLSALSKVSMTPAERLARVNQLLARDLDGTGRFITMFYMRLRENHSQIRWVRAGHDPAIRYCPATDTFSELDGEGLPLGVLDDTVFADNETTLESGEVVVLATDGVWEARNPDGEMFGKERMLAIIRENAHNGSDDIRKTIMDAVVQFQHGDQADDMAVVVVKKT